MQIVVHVNGIYIYSFNCFFNLLNNEQWFKFDLISFMCVAFFALALFFSNLFKVQ